MSSSYIDSKNEGVKRKKSNGFHDWQRFVKQFHCMRSMAQMKESAFGNVTYVEIRSTERIIWPNILLLYMKGRKIVKIVIFPPYGLWFSNNSFLFYVNFRLLCLQNSSIWVRYLWASIFTKTSCCTTYTVKTRRRWKPTKAVGMWGKNN